MKLRYRINTNGWYTLPLVKYFPLYGLDRKTIN